MRNRKLIVRLLVALILAVTLSSCWPMYRRGYGPGGDGSRGSG